MNSSMWKTDEVPGLYLTALCAWREARGTSDEAITGVLCTIRNRVRNPRWWGTDWASVVLKPYQFSSFNADDPNAHKIPAADDKIFSRILDLTALVIMGQLADPTGGATHYHDPSKPNPPWADKIPQVAKIGPFTFYKEG